MPKVIYHMQANGHIAITTVVDESQIEKIAEQVSEGYEYVIMDSSEKTPDAVFVDSWVLRDGALQIDADFAIEYTLSILREKRDAQFIIEGVPYKLSNELEEAVLSDEKKNRLNFLRNITEPLKNIDKNRSDLVDVLKKYLSDSIFL